MSGDATTELRALRERGEPRELCERWLGLLEQSGFALVPGVFSPAECAAIAGELATALAACRDESAALRRAGGAAYGARNLLSLYPPARTLWQQPTLVDLLSSLLGPACGLVRGLFFDKPPGAGWSLPWHQDLTIAVERHDLPTTTFRNPTTKAGIPHVEAPDELLHQMLTLRIHLDDMTADNGPLLVLPGTHTSRNAPPTGPATTILAAAGDVLAMRPLLSHSSAAPAPGNSVHRRILHLEFAASEHLPDRYHWQSFTPLVAEPSSRRDCHNFS
jgi:hypothetical protein